MHRLHFLSWHFFIWTAGQQNAVWERSHFFCQPFFLLLQSDKTSCLWVSQDFRMPNFLVDLLSLFAFAVSRLSCMVSGENRSCKVRIWAPPPPSHFLASASDMNYSGRLSFLHLGICWAVLVFRCCAACREQDSQSDPDLSLFSHIFTVFTSLEKAAHVIVSAEHLGSAFQLSI